MKVYELISELMKMRRLKKCAQAVLCPNMTNLLTDSLKEQLLPPLRDLQRYFPMRASLLNSASKQEKAFKGSPIIDWLMEEEIK